IVGGDNTTIEDVPYQISLQVYGGHNCGGSIISKEWIVTAGHCVSSAVSSHSVRAGTTFHNTGGSHHTVAEIIRHEGYGSDKSGFPINDIALIRVQEVFQFDETRQPIPLFNPDEEAIPGSISVITGWGNTLSEFPDNLQTVDVPIISKAQCNENYASYGGIPENEICAAYPGGGKDACQGDSGGPLAIEGRLAGLTSWGIGCARPEYPGVYTERRGRVSGYQLRVLGSIPGRKFRIVLSVRRIVGGDNTTIENVSYQISLQVYGGHNCGGSIISKEWIVTAGHCVSSDVSIHSVRAGTTFHNMGGSHHTVAEIVRHEGYGLDRSGFLMNDIALIRVNEVFQFDETRQPIPLFNPDEEAIPGSISVITGWGDTLSEFPDNLQTVDVTIISKAQCNENYASYGGIPENEICAAYPGGGKDACQGDSGGPLAIEGRLAGLTSWGIGCARPEYPGVYTEVAAFRSWIKQKTGI
ncbi:GSCOCG00004375001-RA-CDS, partial [Cotesia congregata]